MKAGEERCSEDPGLGLVPVPPDGNAVDMQKLSTDVLLTQSVKKFFSLSLLLLPLCSVLKNRRAPVTNRLSNLSARYIKRSFP